MSLSAGTTIGSYHVTAKIGQGGMGQVWQATDTQIHRDVALKILPDAFAADPDRLARFKREAQILARLNHPNIAAIYGIEEAEGTRALVLELVEGPTLADRISKGPIPLDEALPIAKQIAEALEAAHEAGVIHRDLKPANIKVREDGTVKVLDFGLAKALDPTPEGDPSQSPTLTTAATQMGVIMGTAAYMSPEQARGKTVDKRADIWAFGCVLYETLTGTRPFDGGDISEVLAGVIKSEPHWEHLPNDLPPILSNLLRRCLEKDARERLRDIGDARLVMKGAFETAPTEHSTGLVATVQRSSWRQTLSLAIATLVAGSLVSGLAVWRLMFTEALRPVRLAVDVPSTDLVVAGTSSGIALSPDGASLVYVGSRDGVIQLFRRSFDQFGVTPIPNTENGRAPFFHRTVDG